VTRAKENRWDLQAVKADHKKKASGQNNAAKTPVLLGLENALSNGRAKPSVRDEGQCSGRGRCPSLPERASAMPQGSSSLHQRQPQGLGLAADPCPAPAGRQPAGWLQSYRQR